MSYIVIHTFRDAQDFNHLYKEGEQFPRLGMKVSESRINELASNKNKIGKPLIEKKATNNVELKATNLPDETKEVTYTKTEINRMSTADLKKLALENGLDSKLSGGELKKLLIEHFSL